MRTVKEAAKEALAWMTLRLSYSVRRVLYLADEGFRYRHLQDLAYQADICGFVADGEYGVIQGDITDTVVFRTYLKQKNWTPATNVRFVHFLRDGGTYLDIGAHIGLTTIPIARNPRVICVAFEPTPINFRLLSANVAANCPHDNVTLHNVALFDRNTTVTFELSPKNSGDNRIRFNDKDGEYGETAWHIIETPARKLDDLMAETRGPSGPGTSRFRGSRSGSGDDATGAASTEKLRKCFRRVVVVSPVAPFGATGDAR